MTGKKGRQSKAEAERKRRAEQLQKEQKQRRQLISVLLFALSVFLFALALTGGQRFWLTMHKILFGLFGVFAYGIGPVLFLLALMIAYEKNIGRRKVIFTVLLVLSVCGAFLIFGNLAVTGDTFPDKIANLYLAGTGKRGGGVISAAAGWTLLELLGNPGANVVILLLIFVFFMLLTGKSLMDLIETVRRPMNRRRERLAERRDLLPESSPDGRAPETKRRPPAAPRARPAGKLPAEPRKVVIDVPLGPPVPDGDRADLPFEPTGAAEESPEPQKPEAELLRSIFEEAEREQQQERDVFAAFSQPKPAADPDTEQLIRRAADGYLRQEEKAEEKEAQPRRPAEYHFPPVELLERDAKGQETDVTAELRANADFLVSTLESFGVKTRVVDISRGPTVTRYELQPNTGVRLNRITNLADDLALNLATAGVRIEAPIPNKAAVGIEVPNKLKRMVRLRSIVESDEFRRSASPLTAALGRDIGGKIMVADIARMPHLLIAGTTGSGKSRCLHSMILSLIYKSSPEELRFVLIDPKMVEFGIYNGIPSMLIPVVTDARKASGALGWAVGEMLKRYKLFSECGVRDITSYNRAVERGEISLGQADGEEPPEPEKLPRVVIVIDELADLMMAAPREVEDSICRLAQMARAAGLHLIIATQRPSVDVITGVIKANISSRIALSVSSQIDSRTIIDSAGAEKLIGNGDMLFLPLDLPKPVRIQGCFVSDEEIDRVITDLKQNAVIEYNEQVLAEIERQSAEDGGRSAGGASGDETDSMLDAAVATVVEAGQASTSLLQRRLKLGYSRAARIMDEMEQMGIIGPPDGSKPRAVNMTTQQWQEFRVNRDQRQ